MVEKIKGLVIEEEGQGLSEYGVLLAGVVVVVGLAVGALSGQLQAFFGTIGEKLDAAVNGAE